MIAVGAMSFCVLKMCGVSGHAYTSKHVAFRDMSHNKTGETLYF
jgi:hypothetical protein